MNSRPRDDRGFVSLQVLAATMAVVIAVTAFLVSGLPDRVGCEIGGSITTVTGGPDPDCDTTTTTSASSSGDATVDLLASDNSDDDPTEQNRPDSLSGGGLTAKTYSTNDWVASPGTQNTSPAAAVTAATDVRCALAPDRSTWESKICLVGDSDDPQEFTQGSTDLIRCPATETAPSFQTCFPTTDDNTRGHRTTLRTGPNDNDARFCQPVRVQATSPGSAAFRIDWGCASWAGNLYHCFSTVPAATIGTRNPDGFLTAGIGWTPRDNWTQDPTNRTLWPRTCDSRTFPTGTLSCVPNETTNLATCTLRAYQSLPVRPASCVYFHPHSGEQGQPTHTVGLPMHCRLTTAGDPGATTAKIEPAISRATTLTTRCPTARRTLQADTTVGQIFCGAPQRATGQQGQAWVAFSTELLNDPQGIPTSTVQAVPVQPEGAAASVTNTQMTFVHLLSEHLEPGGAAFEVPNTIFHGGGPAWLQVPVGFQMHNAFLVPLNAPPQEVHVPFALWILSQLGIEHTNPLHATMVVSVIEILTAIDSGQLPTNQTVLDDALTPAELLTHATHLAANAVPADEAALATFVFATHVAVATQDTDGTVDDVVNSLQGAVAELASTLSTPELSTGVTQTLSQSLAALVNLGTPLSQADAALALGLQAGQDDFWDPVPVPDLPDDEQAQVNTVDVDAVLVVEQPGEPDASGLVCLALLLSLCGKP